jgi:hypothetical protein
MLELPKEHFSRLYHLFDAGQPNSTMIYSALEGRTLGRAFVDDVDSPSCCLLVTNFFNFSFTHDTVDQEWLNQTVAWLRPGLNFTLNWPDKMGALQPPPYYSRALAGYEFMQYNAQGDFALPANRHLRRMDKEVVGRCEWRDLMLMAYGTAEIFLEKAFGVCVMDGDQICSEAYAAFLGAGKFEIGIVTNEMYRQQGNAYLACKGLLQLIEEAGYPPHWSYFEGNVASDATARKLGFDAQREYRWYQYPQVQAR